MHILSDAHHLETITRLQAWRLLEKAEKLKTTMKKIGAQAFVTDWDDTVAYGVVAWFEKAIVDLGQADYDKHLDGWGMYQKYKVFNNVEYWDPVRFDRWAQNTVDQNDLDPHVAAIPGSIEALWKIPSETHLWFAGYLSARRERNEESMRRMLERLGAPPGVLFFPPNHATYADTHKIKCELLRYMYPEVQLHIDDHPLIIKEASVHFPGRLCHFNADTEGECPEGKIISASGREWSYLRKRLAHHYPRKRVA